MRNRNNWYALGAGLGLALTGFNCEDSPNLNRVSEPEREKISIVRPDIVVIPSDPDDNLYLDDLLENKELEPIQPFVNLGFIRKYSVYQDSRVSGFISEGQDEELYGGKPGINDWIGDDFKDAKVLFFTQGTRRPYFVNGQELKTWDERMDCPSCEFSKPYFADIIKDARNVYGSDVGGAVFVLGRLNRQDLSNRLMTEVYDDEGERRYSVPQFGIAYNSDGKWEIDQRYSTNSWNDVLHNWDMEFIGERIKEAGER